DARDQGSWIVSLLERSVTGTFHSVGSVPPFGFGDMLAAIAAEVAPSGSRFTWADSDFLGRAGVDGSALPLWDEGDASAANMMTATPAAACAAGLTPRRLRQTVADIRAETRAPGTAPPGVGLSADREAELLARWAAASR